MPAQIPMFDTIPFVRTSQTSKAAATAIVPKLNVLQAKVLSYLASLGAIGATDEAMQEALQMNPSTQRPRRIELLRKGLIRDSGFTRRTNAGRYATVWMYKGKPPYPFCFQPEKCIHGRCERNPVCNE